MSRAALANGTLMARQDAMIIAAERPEADLGRGLRGLVERVTGIEPALSAWESTELGQLTTPTCRSDRLTRRVAALIGDRRLAR